MKAGPKRLPLLGRASAPEVAAKDAERAAVRAWVVGAVEDAGALRFARVLAEALGVPLVREVEGLGDARAIAVGVELVGRVAPSVTIVIGGTLPTSAWRPELRGVSASIALAEPREDLALRLAERWRAAASSDGDG